MKSMREMMTAFWHQGSVYSSLLEFANWTSLPAVRARTRMKNMLRCVNFGKRIFWGAKVVIIWGRTQGMLGTMELLLAIPQILIKS